MFWTAFVWGLGVSCGASIGAMGFIMLLAAWHWLLELYAGSEIATSVKEFNKLSVAALERRNELTVEQNEYLEKIALAAMLLTKEEDKTTFG